MKAVTLASGGVDSSVMMLLLKKDGHELLPLFIDYGQLASKREWSACQDICHYLGLKPYRMDISGFGEVIRSGITDKSLDIEKDAFLPTRNLLFLTIGAAYGYSKSVNVVAIGLLSDPIFPDQTVEFVKAAQRSISISLGVDFRILAPLISLNKFDIFGLADKYGLPVDLTYSCHSGSEVPCGSCISCKDRISVERYSSRKES